MLCCVLHIQNLFISCKFVPWKASSLFSHPWVSIILLSISISLAVLEATCKWHHMVFVFLQLISLSAMPSRSIHVVANDRILLWCRLMLSPYLDYVLIHGSANIFLISSFHFFGGSEDKASTCNAGDLGSIPGLERSLGEGNGNSLQYSCLENPMDRGAWQATVHGVTKSRTWLSNFTFTFHKWIYSRNTFVWKMVFLPLQKVFRIVPGFRRKIISFELHA